MGFAELIERHRDEPLPARASVVGHDDNFVRNLFHLIDEDEQILVSRADDHNHFIADRFQRLHDRITRCDSETAAYDDDRPVALFDNRRISERAQHRSDGIPRLFLREFIRRRSDRLKDEHDPAFFRIRIRDRQRNAFSVILVELHDDELPRFAVARNFGSFEFHVVDAGGNFSLFKNFEHSIPSIE